MSGPDLVTHKPSCTIEVVSLREKLLAERRRRRRAGDPRLSPEDRELLGRLVTGDLASEFQKALDAASAADPLLGGGGDSDQTSDAACVRRDTSDATRIGHAKHRNDTESWPVAVSDG
jgi:hypothetical protein